MKYKVDNAIIMAAGTSSRFAPLSYERPKALIDVRGEILIERQIRQLKEAGIEDVIIVTGYKKEQFAYLVKRFGVKLIENKEYLTRNNNASIYVVREYLKNSYICSADNYFLNNLFEKEVDGGAYYAAIYSEGETAEWCMQEDKDGYINEVSIGGCNSWYMMGHTFWDKDFSENFIKILEQEYNLPETKNLLWEGIFIRHLNELKMKMRKYPKDYIFEFDTLDELREFDASYVNNTRSQILISVAEQLGCQEKDIEEIQVYKNENFAASGFTFKIGAEYFTYDYERRQIGRMKGGS
ncbi:MAG: NTP transferase domain-containing protein [Lachnospiraceae bacterium]|nr:NTP transferase domain-containing protein [Lachnospiraceae bacterium]